MWLPDFVYRYKPHLLIAAGLLCLLTFNNIPGNFAGWVLVAAGGLIYWARRS